ncbi:hypothetical protein PpBr36_02656 [Pyricularia pennisetigena]|uniref:hypothetical protein n=1 Tax=Pyricularia pennisetigena TaxID=1578925 RepID=UPI00114FB8BD|nr:hypothetical protein PpBr36_02656 [Pyricularia pennisetigena]TLS30085.1 hypothetical protein PpBr36_02656 [Pyricularia pennisetigena]
MIVPKPSVCFRGLPRQLLSARFNSTAQAQQCKRPKYAHFDIAQYFNRIHLSPAQQIFSVSKLTSVQQLAYLTLLKKHHLVNVPYENLQAHYSWHKGLGVSPTRLFKKIVRHRRGGWCFETNQLFNTVLLSLGFDVILAGSRVFEPCNGKFGGLVHCVNIVKIGGVHYLLDVGFGGYGPPRPVPLLEGTEGIKPDGLQHIGPRAEMRIVKQAIAQQVDQTRRLWVYQFRSGPDKEWQPMCCFNSDFEFLPEDIEILNTHGMSRTSFTSRELLLQRFTTSNEALDAPGRTNMKNLNVMDGKLDGSIVLYQNRLRWRREGDLILSLKFRTEAERIEAIRLYFGIVLDKEESDGIKGTASEIRGSWFGTAFNEGTI